MNKVLALLSVLGVADVFAAKGDKIAIISALDASGTPLSKVGKVFAPGTYVDMTLELGSYAGYMTAMQFDFLNYGFEHCKIKYQSSSKSKSKTIRKELHMCDLPQRDFSSNF